MNPELPKNPREELELRVTALLLGELSTDEAAAVREAIAKNPELSKLHDDLKETIQLVRTATTSVSEPVTGQTTPLQLSEARRKKLLTSFVIPPLKPSHRKAKPALQFHFLEALAVLAIIGVLAVMLLPALYPARSLGKRQGEVTLLPTKRAEEELLTLGVSAPEPAVAALVEDRVATETLQVPPSQSVAGVDPANVVGYVNVVTASPAQDLRASQYAVSGQVADPRGNVSLGEKSGEQSRADFEDYLKQSQRNLAAGQPAFAPAAPVAAPAPAQPLSQIVLPSLMDADTDGLAEDGARQNDRSAGAVALFANGLESTRGLDRNGRGPSGPTEAPVAQKRWTISSALRGFYDDNVNTSSATEVDTFGFEISPSIRFELPMDQTSSSLESAVKLQPAPVANVTSAGDPAFGTFKSDELERGRAGGAEGKPGEVAAGATVAPERFYRFSPGGGGGGGGGGGAGRGATVTKVPVLGDLPVLGKLFRSESGAEPTRTREIAANDFSTLNLESAQGKLGADKQAWFEANNPRGESTVNAGPLALGLPSIELQKKLPADSFYAGDKLAANGGRSVPEQSAFGFEVADNSAGVAVKPSGAGNIVLPSTPATEGMDQLAIGRRASTRLMRQPAPDSGVNIGNSPALVQEGRQLLEAGKPVEAEAGFKTVLEADPKSDAAKYYLSYAKEAQTRNAERRRSGVVEAGLAEEQQAGAKLEQRIAQKKNEVETLRQQLEISEMDAAGTAPTPSLEADTLRRYAAQSIEASARLAELESSVNKLKGLNSEELKQVLPRTRPDPVLGEQLSQLNLAEQRLAALKKDSAPDQPEYKRVQSQVEDLKRKTDESVVGIMEALDNQVGTAKTGVEKLQELVENAKRADMEKAQKGRPYYAKKRELEELVKARTVLATKLTVEDIDVPAIRRPVTNAPIPQLEIQTSENAFSTFSLNVSDVSFKLAAASLEQGQMPDAASVRGEEFINAFDYRDPEPVAGAPIAFAWERTRYPFAHNRDLLRFSLKTAAAGRQAGRPLNVVLLLDNSGSMERADRVHIIREALRVLASQLQPQDKLSVITFARTPRLVADGITGDKAGEVAEQVSGLTPQGGTNLEDAMNLAYQTAAKHYLASGINRVVLLTDGAANLGNVEPESLKQKVEAQRKQGIALDAFGIGWEGFNDDLLEVLSRNGDGRYGFINSPEEAATDFAGQLAGALKVAASDVKVQVEFNPKRVTAYRQIGYAKHQLTKEQFRDNTVDAAEIAAQEAGNALYTVEVNPAGEGPLGTVRVRYKIPGTTDYREQAWDVPFAGNAAPLEHSSPAMRLAASASAFSEWLVASPFAGEVTPDRLLGYLGGVPEVYGADSRPKKLEWMIRQAKSLEGK